MVATIDCINRGTTSVVDLAEIGRCNWYTTELRFKKGTTGSEQGSLKANSCNVAQCVAVCMCYAYGLQKAVPEARRSTSSN